MKDRWFLLSVISSFIFITINAWAMIMNTYLLNTYNYQDTTAIDQALSSTLFSHSFFFVPYLGFNFFSVHAAPFFFALLPFYSLFPNFNASYIIQSILIFSPSVPLYLLAKRFIGNGGYAFLISLTYLFYWGLPSQFPFEEVVMFAGPAIFAVYFLETRRVIPFIISFILMLSTIEFAPFVGLFFFLYIAVREGVPGKLIGLISRKITKKVFLRLIWNPFLLSSIILSVAFIFIDNQITLFFSSGAHPIYINISGSNFFSIQSLVNGIRTNDGTKIINIMYYEAPYMFLSFLDPIFILQLPWIFVSSFASLFYYYSPGNYYNIFFAAFIPIGFIYGLKRIHDSAQEEKKKSIVKKVVVFVLVFNILIFVAAGTAQGYYDISSQHVTPGDQAPLILAQQLVNGRSVEVGVDELPVVGMYDWNETIYPSNSQYILFNNSPPTTLSDYGFLAADDQYMLYEKNYTLPPRFNYFRYSVDGSIGQVFNTFVPPGNYSVNVSIVKTHYEKPLVLARSVGWYPLAVGQAIAVPFRVSNTEVLEGANIPVNYFGGHPLYEGAWLLTGGISTSLHSIPVSISSETTFPVHAFEFNNITILPNVTYYFWFYPDLSNTGGLTVGQSAVNGTSYLANIESGSPSNITKLNFTLPITLLFRGSAPASVPASVSVGGMVTNVTLNRGESVSIPFNIRSSVFLPFSVNFNSTDSIAFSGSVINVEIHSNEKVKTILLLDYPYPLILLLVIVLIGTSLIFIFYSFNLKRGKERVNKASWAVSLVSLIAFWSFYSLSYYGIVTFLNDYILLKAIGIIMAASLLVAVITYDWK
ncbi:MAG: DUF2079 domain-containing protein [Thermoplasmatales archaeon]